MYNENQNDSILSTKKKHFEISFSNKNLGSKPEID